MGPHAEVEADETGDHVVEGDDSGFSQERGPPPPTKQGIRETQAVLSNQPKRYTPAGLVQWGSDGAYQVGVNGEWFSLSLTVPRDCRRD